MDIKTSSTKKAKLSDIDVLLSKGFLIFYHKYLFYHIVNLIKIC